jgi:inorganic triphosphatase YgiF
VDRINSRKEQAMTDWDLINEYIQRAMQAVDEAHNATKKLKEKATPEAFDQFRVEMQELTEHLTQLQTILNHSDTYALNELADWLSTTFGGEHAEYRHTPHMELDKTKS